MPMSEIIDKIRARLEACPIPEGAVADWKDTRHFEIQRPTPPGVEFWWLEPEDWQLAMLPHMESSDECQERCGAVLDYAVAYRGDVQALLAFIEEAKNEAYRECAKIAYENEGVEAEVEDAIRRARPQAFEKP